MLDCAYGRDMKRRRSMSVAKIVEISSESPTSFEDAIVQGIAKASKTVYGMKSGWVNEQHVVIENGKVTLYRVNRKVTFVVD
jgi:dodecin